MRSAIGSAGRVVISKPLRDRLATPMCLVRRRGGRVAVPEEKLPPLTDDVVRATLERTRR
jgi:hypothetical protein